VAAATATANEDQHWRGEVGQSSAKNAALLTKTQCLDPARACSLARETNISAVGCQKFETTDESRCGGHRYRMFGDARRSAVAIAGFRLKDMKNGMSPCRCRKSNSQYP
jgi:hypothetical protein